MQGKKLSIRFDSQLNKQINSSNVTEEKIIFNDKYLLNESFSFNLNQILQLKRKQMKVLTNCDSTILDENCSYQRTNILISNRIPNNEMKTSP